MTALLETGSTNSALEGKPEPRLWTPAKRDLTDPESTYGYDVIDFARDFLDIPLDPWQQFVVIHAGELLKDNRTPRFRQVLVTVARQNGKTELLVILTLYWLFVDKAKMVLSTSVKLDTARESWKRAIALASRSPTLAKRIESIHTGAGMEELNITGGGRYKIASSSPGAARGLRVDRLIMDELREHHSWDPYAAAAPTISAVPDAQIWMISNAGDDKSVVLQSLREQALAGTDDRLCILEWSAPEGAAVTDLEALRQANPNLGVGGQPGQGKRVNPDGLLGMAARAEAAGGDQLAVFKTEHHCVWVPKMSPAVNLEAWAQCYIPGTLDDARSKVCLCFDLDLDGMHATLYAAAKMDDEKVRIEVVNSWAGSDSADQLRRDLPGWLNKIKPRALGWFPRGPGAALAADMAFQKLGEGISSDITSVCMGFAEQVQSRHILHSGDPLLDEHIRGAEKQGVADAWKFARRGAGHIDAAYAAAGAVHLARTAAPSQRAYVVVPSHVQVSAEPSGMIVL